MDNITFIRWHTQAQNPIRMAVVWLAFKQSKQQSVLGHVRPSEASEVNEPSLVDLSDAGKGKSRERDRQNNNNSNRMASIAADAIDRSIDLCSQTRRMLSLCYLKRAEDISPISCYVLPE